MDKIYRDNVDLQVAVNSGLAHTATRPAEVDTSMPPVISTLPLRGSLPVRMMRGVGKIIFRCLKPIIKPLLERLKHYFNAELEQQMQGYHRENQQQLALINKELQKIAELIVYYQVVNRRALTKQCGITAQTHRRQLKEFLTLTSSRGLSAGSRELADLLDPADKPRDDVEEEYRQNS